MSCAQSVSVPEFFGGGGGGGGGTPTSGVKFHTFLAFSDGESSKTVLLLKVVYLAVNKTRYCIECAH